MNLVTQPKRSKVCGHAVVAMILGIPLSEAVELIGHRKGTSAAELRLALRRRGADLGRVKLPRHSDPPPCCIMRFRYHRRRIQHWVLRWDGIIYDPSQTPIENGILISFMHITPSV